ncbi:hypothetical protein [Rathayibacter sp. SD072]|uniref:hypothetical protein n=1 Tax=Rathayibacter sp. SD072 TaxID=2781731 RepID=UPI001A956996|nr:hypothetical protein [Rathayibacter sp. SD072]MBO0984041.1 hypothetical protein [Rathayibacter sp. SD072]
MARTTQPVPPPVAHSDLELRVDCADVDIVDCADVDIVDARGARPPLPPRRGPTT